MKHTLSQKSPTLCAVLASLLVCCAAPPVVALDLLPDLFAKETVKADIWVLSEQYVRLVAIESGAPMNDHPQTIDPADLEHALSSLKLWVKGGVFRNEEAEVVYPPRQAATIARYLSQALAKAGPDEDVTFNVRGYFDVLLSMGKEREWTSGRAFYRDGKLNLIIGEHHKRLDKAKKNVEGSFGITEDFRDVHFATGSRKSKGNMTGRIVNSEGVENVEEGKLRPDWVRIDVAKAAVAFRDSRTPLAIRKEEQKAKAEAAKLTLERRQMREEMARLRKELRDLQGAGGAAREPVEERLARLQELLGKGLITEDDFEQRKQAILNDI